MKELLKNNAAFEHSTMSIAGGAGVLRRPAL